MLRCRLPRARGVLALAGACLLCVLAPAGSASAKPVSSAVLKHELALSQRLSTVSGTHTIAHRRVGQTFGSDVVRPAASITRVEDHAGRTLAIALAGAALAVALASGLAVAVRLRRVSAR